MTNGWWVHQMWEQGGMLLVFAWVFWVICSIVLHELAHGWVALWQGDDTPRRLGRMTINPLVHMGGTSLIVFALVGIAWGVMPTNPSNYRWGRRGHIAVAAAGPAMNIALAVAAMIGAGLVVRHGDPTSQTSANLELFLTIGGMLNVMLACFNLLPAPPLDGAMILAGFSDRVWRWVHMPNAPFIGLAIMMLFFSTDIDQLLYRWPMTWAAELKAAVAGVTM
ncbi:MAG: site-2 protease family protein [Phycisphaerales bacterium]